MTSRRVSAVSTDAWCMIKDEATAGADDGGSNKYWEAGREGFHVNRS